jgi:hypothetical protein
MQNPASGAGLQIVGQKRGPTMVFSMLVLLLVLLRVRRTKLKIELDL